MADWAGGVVGAVGVVGVVGVWVDGRVGRQRRVRVRMREENRTEFRESQGATALNPRYTP